MKKNIKYLGIIAIVNMLFITNVNAYTISVEPNGHETPYGYNTQSQLISGGNCSGVPVYCIEKGASNPSNFYNCEAIDVSVTPYATVDDKYADHDTREYMYRVLADNFGDAANSKNGRTINNYSSIQDYSNWLPSNSLDNIAEDLKKMISTNVSNKLNGSENIFSYDAPKYNPDGTSATVTMTLKSTIEGLKFSIINGNGKILSTNYSDGIYTIVATTSISECKGGDFDLKVESNGKITVGKKGTYLIKCNSPYQNYIVTTTDNCTINDLMDKNIGNSNTYPVSVPDPNCDCKGTTTMTGRCDTSGEVTDLEKPENLKTCIREGGFVEYCKTNLQKQTDNGKNAEGPVLSITRPGTTNTNLLKGNNYCKVYCLENIKYDLPGTINTDNGSYFKLKKGWDKKTDAGSPIKIEGTRTCYTSEIQKQEFIIMVKGLQNRIRDKWNDYQKNKKIKEIIENKEKYKKTGYKNCPYTENVRTDKKDENGNYIYQPKTVYKEVEYTFYSASNVEYDVERGKTAGDGTWIPNPQKDTVNVTWGNNPTCNADGSITEDKTEPEYNLNTAYKALLIELANEIEKYKSCTEWTNNYCFDPKISFSYDEPYNDKIHGELNKTVKDIKTNDIHYYTSVNDSYTQGAQSSGQKSTLNYIFVDETTSSIQTSRIDINTIYMKSEVIKEATFADATKDVYTYQPYGTIVIKGETVSKPQNLIHLGYVLPVALQHEPDTGVNNYYLSINNIGVGGDDTTCKYTNKIIGESCSIFNTKNEIAEGKEYICQYTTKKCPECEIECVCPDGSTNCYVENKVCKYVLCPECEIECVGCIWNNGDTTISYKNISLDDVYKDDSNIGSNWTQEDVGKIEDKGQEIYDSEPMYSFTLTPSTMAKIRNYNELSIEGNNKNVPKGGYNNDTLICKDGKNCKSTFLREYLPKSAVNIIPEN